MSKNRVTPELLDAMPPAAVESEKALLCGALVLNRIPTDMALEPRHFYREENQTLWRVMNDLDGEHGQFDMTMLGMALEATDRPPGFDWPPYLGELAYGTGLPSTMPFHAEQIRKAYVNRTVGEEALQLFQESRNGGITPEALRDRFDRLAAVASDKENPTETLRFPLVSSSTLDSADYTASPIITETLFAGSPAVIGGMFKTGKTLLATDVAISIATGRPFLGAWTVPEPRDVIYFTGEGGPSVAQEYGRRIAASKGLFLNDVANLHWCFSVPRLEDLRDLDAFAKVLDDTAAEVAILDNLMLCLSGDNAGNVYSMGGVLEMRSGYVPSGALLRSSFTTSSGTAPTLTPQVSLPT